MPAAYQAYISYSHADARFAAWLHRALETYRLPRALVGRLGRQPLKPIFRDRADLRSSTDLHEALKAALRNSSALVVVCSKDAAASHWVNEEVGQFREMHGDARVFCVVAKDAPPECFPAAILRSAGGASHEPIAADARRDADGRRGAVLKLVAALLQVELDDLVRRDTRRQYRRMTVAAISASAVAAVMLTLAIIASNARDAAERRSVQAENLVGFMLGDLRSRLSPIGRLDVMDAIGEKTLQYFSSLEDSDVTAASQLGRAQALRQIGEVRMAQGNVESALAAFSASNAQANGLVDRFGAGNAASTFELSQSHFWIGYAHFTRREFLDARHHLERYLELSNQLSSKWPDEAQYQTEIAYAHSNLGTLELFEGNFDAANRHFGSAAEIETRALATAPDDPSLKRNLAETLSWLGSVAASSISIGDAIRRFEAEHDLRVQIAAAVADKAHDEKVADAAVLLGHQLMLAGDLAGARRRFDEAKAIGDALTKYDPSNAVWRRSKAYVVMELARLATVEGRFDAASDDIVGAVDEMRQLCERDPANAERRGDLISALAQQVRVARLRNDSAGARTALREALQRLVPIDANDDTPSRVSRAGLRLLEGDLDDGEQAVDAWRKGLAVIGEMRGVHEPSALLTRIALMERMQQSEEAAPLRAQLAEMGFKDTPSRALAAALVDGIRVASIP